MFLKITDDVQMRLKKMNPKYLSEISSSFEMREQSVSHTKVRKTEKVIF